MKDRCLRVLAHVVLLVGLAGVLVGATGGSTPANEPEFWLITSEEAAMPSAPDKHGQPGGSPFDVGREPPDTGPVIDVLKPTEGAVPTVPLEVLIRFAPRGAPVDVNSLQVSVVKFIMVDITDRILPYVSPAGIQIPDARLPSGKHTVRISLADTSGGVSNKQMTVIVP